MVRVRMTTDVEREGVRYRVVLDYGQIVWERYVAFGQDDRHRAGGAAFREAAREQDDRARAEYHFQEEEGANFFLDPD